MERSGTITIGDGQPGGGWRGLVDPPVTVKILSGVLAGLIGMAVVFATATLTLGQVRDRGQRIYDTSLQEVIGVEKIRQTYLQVRVDAVADATLPPPKDGAASADVPKPEHTAFVKDLQATQDALAAFGRRDLNADQRGHLNDLSAVMGRYSALVGGPLLQIARTGDLRAYVAMRDQQVKPLAQAIQQDLDGLVDAVNTQTMAVVHANTTTYRSAVIELLVVFVLAGVVAVVLAGATARHTVRPLRRVRDACAAIAAGDLTRRVNLTGRDEIAQTGRALDAATANTQRTVQALSESATVLASAAEELTTTAESIVASTVRSSERAGEVSSATEAISSGIHSLAAGAEEISSSIGEIARNTAEAARVGIEARELAETTNTLVAQLGNSSTEIGNIIKVITSIAEQTNLLALNATIESARAGDAGRGFAVVAGEVKELAQETAQATDDIQHRVQAIQTDSAQAVKAIAEISEVITRLGDFQTVIASAVEEQGVTTQAMSQDVTQASDQTALITTSVRNVADATTDAAAGIEQASTAIHELSEMSTRLHTLVRQFTY
jgi:methyl-accepting chemotaxis protein